MRLPLVGNGERARGIYLTFPFDPVILDAQCLDIGRFEQVADIENNRLFQACLDDVIQGALPCRTTIAGIYWRASAHSGATGYEHAGNIKWYRVRHQQSPLCVLLFEGLSVMQIDLFTHLLAAVLQLLAVIWVLRLIPLAGKAARSGGTGRVQGRQWGGNLHCRQHRCDCTAGTGDDPARTGHHGGAALYVAKK